MSAAQKAESANATSWQRLLEKKTISEDQCRLADKYCLCSSSKSGKPRFLGVCAIVGPKQLGTKNDRPSLVDEAAYYATYMGDKWVPGRLFNGIVPRK
jgi:hypothetical protein